MILKNKDKIHFMRREMGLTLKALAEKIEVYYQRIWSWEKGIYSPTLDEYDRLCALYEEKTGNKRPE
jgi:DNA-binding XRE family transcriptional regulator